jgi:glycine reductase
MKKLRIGNFHVKDIVFGEKTSFKNGVLTVNKEEALACLDPDGELKNIQLYIVRPGDSTRILPCKVGVEPRFRPDGRSTFPGLIGHRESCGDGDLYAMKGISVISCGKYAQASDGILDMTGPGARHSFFAKMVNLVIYAELIHPTGVDQPFRNEAPLKLAGHLLADYVAKSLAGQEPEDWECYEWEPGAAEAEKKGLPRVAYFSQMRGQVGRDKFFNDQIFGIDVENMLPVLVHPNAVFDGQISSFGGLYGDGFYSYAYQNQPVLKRLYREHGKTINFVGIVFWACDSADQVKQTVKLVSGELASLLKLDAAIVHSTAGASNYDVDFFYLLAEFEDRGIKAVGLTGEHSGKSMLDPKGDAIVTGGDSGNIFEFPPMDLVIGDINSLVRDFYHGAWTVHEKYGPSLRPDGSIIVNGCMIVDSTNNCGFTTKTVKDF